jgi:hypothetical protein
MNELIYYAIFAIVLYFVLSQVLDNSGKQRFIVNYSDTDKNNYYDGFTHVFRQLGGVGGGGVIMDKDLTVNGDIKMNVDKALLIRGDGNHYIKYGGDTLNGPAIRGCQGGSLGTSAGCNSGTDKVALQWGNDKNVTIGGVFKLPHSIWHKSSDDIKRLFYENNSHTYFGTNDRYFWRSNADINMMELDGAGTLKLKIPGANFCIGDTCINESQLKILTGKAMFKLSSLSNDGQYIGSAGSGNATVSGGDGGWENLRIKEVRGNFNNNANRYLANSALTNAGSNVIN